MTSLSASKIDLSQPDKFEMASVVTKNSRLGITSNKRLLVIKKGYLYYYSNVPKKFKGDSSIVQTIHQLPKCSIEIVNIKQIKGYESNSSYFSIEFDEKNMLEREDIRKTMTLEEFNFSPKKSKDNIVWQFTCDNQFIKQRWVAALQGLRDYYNKEKKDIQKFFNEHKDNLENKSSSSGGRNSQVPWRESQTGNNYKRNNDVNYLQLVGSKSSDDRSLSPDNKYGRGGYLNVPVGGNSPSRVRGNSSNHQPKTITDHSKQYSPNQATIKPYGTNSVISASSSEEDLQPPSHNIENSPINQLELSDVKTSPTKQPLPPASNMMFSKTQKVKISQEMIEEEESESIKTPGPSPMKGLEESSGYQKEVDEFEKTLVLMEGQQGSKSQPNIQLNFDANNNIANMTNGKGMFEEINEKQMSRKMSKNQALTSLVQINLDDNANSPVKQNQFQSNSIAQKENLANILDNSLVQSLPEQLSFYSLHRYMFLSEFSFQQRISLQQQFHRNIHQFSSQCVTLLKQYIESASSTNLPYGFQTLYKTNNSHLIHYKPLKTLLKLAFVTSQSLSINGKEKIYFDEENIKNLKRQFKVYNDFEKFLVLGQVKNDPGFRLRVPLVTLVEYKGIVALCMDQSCFEEDSTHAREVPLNELKKTYHKQIDVLVNQGYEIKDFTFLPSDREAQTYLIVQLLPQIVLIQASKEQYKKSYLKRLLLTKRPQKHHNLQFNPPFTQWLILKAHQTQASTSIESLQQYIRTLQRLQEFQGIYPKQEIIDVLKICVFCKQVRKIYRSAQGEIEETHFLNLILKADANIMKILQQSGCDQVPQIKGILFTFIEHYLGIKCSVNEKALKQHIQQLSKPLANNKNKFKKSDIVQSTQLRAKVLTYEISKTQLMQGYESMRKFISEQKLHLATKAFTMLQNLHLQEFPQLLQKRLQIIYFSGSLAYLQHDYLKCIEHCKNYQKILGNPLDPKLFQVYLLMIKSYSHFSTEEFKHTFEKLIKLIEFNYGSSCSLFVSIYSISAFFFYQLGQKSQPDTKVANPLYLLSFELMSQAEKLCLKHFGPASSQYIDLMMDSARLYQTKDKSKAQLCLNRAKQVIINTQNTHKLIEFFLYQLKLTFVLKQYDQCQQLLNQCYELIFSGKFKLDSQKYIRMVKVKFDIGMAAEGKLYLAQQAIEELWRGDKIDQKKEAISLAAKLVKRIWKLKEFQDESSFYKNSQQHLGSSFSSESFSYSLDFKDSIISKVFDILSESQHLRAYTPQKGLIPRIEEILQEEEEIPSQRSKDSLRTLLHQIA